MLRIRDCGVRAACAALRTLRTRHLRALAWLVTAAAGIAVFLWLNSPTLVHGKDEPDEEIIEEWEADEIADADDEPVRPRRRTRRRSAESQTAQGPNDRGVEIRLGHNGFKTFGRNESISHVELFPYILMDEDMVFGDGRLFVTNDGQLGGNVGLGYRRRVTGWNQIFGASLWYDADDSTGRLFHQAGLSLETYGDVWDLRSNFYLPVDDTHHVFGNQLFNQRFAGTSLLYDQSRRFGEAMPGWDVEAGVVLPGEWARRRNVRAFAGWYYFLGDDVENINGFKTRLEADLFAGLNAQVEYTTDDTFGNNVMAGISWIWSAGFRRDDISPGTRARFGEFVRRNYNIIVSQQRELNLGLEAINPATGQAYVIRHVDTTAGGGGNGAVDDPFTTIAAAQAAGGDIVFVHSGSTITDPVVLQSGQSILGEGVNHTIDVLGYGSILLPTATAGTTRPVIDSIVGDAVTLASNSSFGGFVIDTPTGNGIFGNGVGNVNIHGVDILDAGGAGIQLVNSTGPIGMTAMRIDNATGIGLHIDGGNGSIRYAGSIVNSTDNALLVENTTGGIVDLWSATVTDTGGAGIHIDNSAANVWIGQSTLTNTTGPGITVENSTGDTYFGTATVNANNAGPAMLIDQNPGRTFVETLNLTNTNGGGLQVADSGLVSTIRGTISTTNGRAVDLENSSMDVRLTSVSSNGADYGIRIVDTPGVFAINGTGALGSGGLIQNSLVAGVLLDNAGTVGFNELDLDGNAVGIQSFDTQRLVLSRSRVTDSTGRGLDSLNTSVVEITNSLFSGNGAGEAVRLAVDNVETYNYAITNSTISDLDSDAILVETVAGGEGSVLNLWLMDSIVTNNAAGSAGLNVDWTGAMTAQVGRSLFSGTGNTSTGVLINAGSTTALARIAVGNNTFTYSGTDFVGVDVITAGRSEVVIGSNTINMNGADGTGLRFDLAEDAAVQLLSNAITDNASGGTGVLFASLEGESTVTMDANVISLLAPGVIVDRGIIFTAIDTTNGLVQLISTQNNTVTGATTTFSAPANSTSGGILVNGVLRP